MPGGQIVWRRVDLPGYESARTSRRDGGIVLSGLAYFEGKEGPTRLEYDVVCDDSWRTRSSWVRGTVGESSVDVRLEAVAGRWTLNGVAQPDLEGAIDVDLNFSPSTNLLPIRRLALEIGAEARVVAAWLRFPSFRLEPLEQGYARTGPRAYRYSSGGGRFVRDLEVREDGFVTEYPGFWTAVS
jgi:hypothetical protein